MRILHAMSSVNPSGGGPVEGVKQLGRINTRRGHTVEIASLDAPGADFLQGFPLPVHPLGPRKIAYGYAPRFVPWLRANIKNYDVVIVNGIWQYNSFGAWRVLHRSSTPYVVVTHGMLDPWFKHTYPLKHLKKWLYWPWADYRVLRDAAAVLFTCEEERRLAPKSFWLYSADERVINYGTSAPAGDRQTQKTDFLSCFPELANKRIVLFMGRIHPKKGCDLVLKAFSAVLAANPDWHLVVAGPDQNGHIAVLESLARELGIDGRVTWTGLISGDLKLGAMHSSEILLLPSHQENFGIVVAEALSCGVPVLISDKVNIWREIEADSAGFVASDTAEGASSLLRSWLSLSMQQQTAMCHAARECFAKRFEIHQASSTLLAILRDVIAKSTPGGSPLAAPVLPEAHQE